MEDAGFFHIRRCETTGFWQVPSILLVKTGSEAGPKSTVTGVSRLLLAKRAVSRFGARTATAETATLITSFMSAFILGFTQRQPNPMMIIYRRPLHQAPSPRSLTCTTHAQLSSQCCGSHDSRGDICCLVYGLQPTATYVPADPATVALPICFF